MNRTPIIVYLVLVAAGIGLLALLPGIEGRIAEVELLLADADEVLAARQSRIFSIPGQPDEVETEIQIHRMSYLAVISEKHFQRTAVLVCSPSLIVLGAVALIRLGWMALAGAPRRKRPPRSKGSERRRKALSRGKASGGRPQARRGP